ncbi:MAG: hypothetical protein ACOY3P_00220, partial [Planctomycetota bacterium]
DSMSQERNDRDDAQFNDNDPLGGFADPESPGAEAARVARRSWTPLLALALVGIAGSAFYAERDYWANVIRTGDVLSGGEKSCPFKTTGLSSSGGCCGHSTEASARSVSTETVAACSGESRSCATEKVEGVPVILTSAEGEKTEGGCCASNKECSVVAQSESEDAVVVHAELPHVETSEVSVDSSPESSAGVLRAIGDAFEKALAESIQSEQR